MEVDFSERTNAFWYTFQNAAEKRKYYRLKNRCRRLTDACAEVRNNDDHEIYYEGNDDKLLVERHTSTTHGMKIERNIKTHSLKQRPNLTERNLTT
jgi:hypothetical protein